MKRPLAAIVDAIFIDRMERQNMAAPDTLKLMAAEDADAAVMINLGDLRGAVPIPEWHFCMATVGLDEDDVYEVYTETAHLRRRPR